jgi:hypothetical protein
VSSLPLYLDKIVQSLKNAGNECLVVELNPSFISDEEKHFLTVSSFFSLLLLVFTHVLP